MSKKITNPFGDESSDEEEDFNPFAKKKSTSRPNNPFETNDDSDTQNVPPSKSSSNSNLNQQPKPMIAANKSFSNPFDDDDDDNDGVNNNHVNIAAEKLTTSTTGTNKNPFDNNDDGPNQNDFPTKAKISSATAAAAPITSRPTSVKINQPEKSKSINFNPFDTNHDSISNNNARPAQIERNKTVQTTNITSAINTNNPFDSTSSSTTTTNNNNNNNNNNKTGPSRPNTLHERSKTQPLISMKKEDFSNWNKTKTKIATTTTPSSTSTNNANNTNANSNNTNATIMHSKHKRNATVSTFTSNGNVDNNNINNNNHTTEPSSLTSWLRSSNNNTKSETADTTKTRNESTKSSSSSPKKSIFSSPNRKSNTTINIKTTTTTTSPPDSYRRKTPKRKKKNYIVQCWPYDNYHQEQKEYYTYLQERDSSYYGPNTPSSPGRGLSSSVIISPSSSSSKKKKNVLKKKKKDMAEANGGYYSDGDDDENDAATLSRSKSIGGGGENQLYERPQDLPSVKEAVQNLSLFDFENKAEERAVVIVSTWLYDAGLIDELLANGGSSDVGMGMGIGSPRNSLLNSSNLDAQTVSSVRSSEGIEVGMHGFPIEGGLKIEKEVEKLRASAQRELTLINTRLNDGVAASGSEVQEMVNAVQATRMDLGRLRELVTYISSGYKEDSFDKDLTNGSGDGIKEDGSNEEVKVILSNFPRLKRAINARRNIFRCFRELEFFSQIPLTCDTLREELHAGEWTEHEFTTIRNVCMEHVKLEILLVEAEAGMKTWLDDEDVDDDASMPSLRSSRSLRRHWKGKRTTVTSSHYNVVDNFLSQHVKNVWELGDEIKVRILAGIGSAFELALNNPASMVALVEAVEVYEQAAEQYKASHGEEIEDFSTKNHLRFTNMRASALAQMYTDFELRGLEVFRAIHMQAADVADEADALNSQFNAVMRAATELVTEIDVVKNQMAPCFAPHWRVEMLWSACVAHVCSNQIIQQIGGPEGQNLPELTVTQLLDLVAWVEFFRETIEDAFPAIGQMHSKRTYFEERPDLFAGDDKEVNMENAVDIIAWTNNMLWDVHRLAQDEFLLRTRSQTDELLTKVYSANHETYQTNEMRLISSLCEDVFSLVGVHLRTIRERLTKKSEALVMTVCLIFSQLRAKQMTYRDKFLTDLDTCCAAANDFQRMSEQCEDLLHDIVDKGEFTGKSMETLEESCDALVSLFSGDAVYAAQMAHTYIFKPIWEEISDEIFGIKWETELTHSELALKLTRTLVREGL